MIRIPFCFVFGIFFMIQGLSMSLHKDHLRSDYYNYQLPNAIADKNDLAVDRVLKEFQFDNLFSFLGMMGFNILGTVLLLISIEGKKEG